MASLTARLDNNRQIEFNAGEHRHFDHGYAVTSHSSQGLTAERVLVHADTSVHPDLLNSRFGYVSISRASHEATLFTDDMAKLAPQLGADVSKTSALEINQASSSMSPRELGLLILHLTESEIGLQGTKYPTFDLIIAGKVIALTRNT
jgi:ATP-dependent exoDNAse (exonuclease V) alpha subunit